MLTEPVSVTYNTVAKSMPRVGMTADQSVYRMNDGVATYTMVVSHQFKRRNRTVIRLQRDTYVSDPLTPANSIPASVTATVTADFPTTGVLPVDVQSLTKALVAFCTDATILKVVNGET